MKNKKMDQNGKISVPTYDDNCCAWFLGAFCLVHQSFPTTTKQHKIQLEGVGKVTKVYFPKPKSTNDVHESFHPLSLLILMEKKELFFYITGQEEIPKDHEKCLKTIGQKEKRP